MKTPTKNGHRNGIIQALVHNSYRLEPNVIKQVTNKLALIDQIVTLCGK